MTAAQPRTVKMEEEETEMSKEELQSWIGDEVHKARLTSPGILKKYSLLQSLLQRRQRQAMRFLELCQSLMVFENTVKELYSQLGLEYTSLDSESDDDAESTSCRRTLPFLFVSSEHRVHGPSASRASTRRLSTSDVEEDQEESANQKSPVANLNKEAVVVLHKLTRSQMAATVGPPLPDADNVEDEDQSFGKSDGEWEPNREMSDSECSVSDFSARSNRKRILNKNRGKDEKLNSASKRRRKSAAGVRGVKTSASSASKNRKVDCSVAETSPLPEDADAESSQRDTKELPSSSRKTTKCLTPGAKQKPPRGSKTSTMAAKTPSQAKKTKKTNNSSTTSPTSQATVAQPATPQSSAVRAESNEVKTFTPSASTKVTPVGQPSSISTGTPPSAPKKEIKLNMNVLARRKHFCWQRGKVAEIITKENGKVKYKITFEEKGKSLVSGHHLAFDALPKLDELSIGCRVVVKCPGGEFQPGIMAELPGRKNRMRFLVYIDDHTPMYVGLPALRLVYKPLADPLDDILDEHHKEFIREYLRTWPYPPQTQYKIGQVMSAEYEGTMQKCEVLAVDCSLIEVVFQSDQHKEWLYRGSLRLEHMIKMKYSKLKDDNKCT